MKSNLIKPNLYRIEGGELSLSGKALLDLMTAVLAKGYGFRFSARGWSMIPFIHDGDVITISPFQEKLPSVGDVVAYIHPASEKLIVHRLVRRQGSEWFIQGDNSTDESCERVLGTYLIGRVTRIERDDKEIWLGLGPERYLIVLFLRTGWLLPQMQRLRQAYKERLRKVLN